MKMEIKLENVSEEVAQGRLFTLAQAAERAGMRPVVLYELCRSGDFIPYLTWWDGGWHFNKADIERLKRIASKQPKPTNNALLSPQEVCNILRISKKTLTRYRKNRQISYVKQSGRVMFRQSDVDDYLETHSL